MDRRRILDLAEVEAGVLRDPAHDLTLRGVDEGAGVAAALQTMRHVVAARDHVGAGLVDLGLEAGDLARDQQDLGVAADAARRRP